MGARGRTRLDNARKPIPVDLILDVKRLVDEGVSPSNIAIELKAKFGDDAVPSRATLNRYISMARTGIGMGEAGSYRNR